MLTIPCAAPGCSNPARETQALDPGCAKCGKTFCETCCDAAAFGALVLPKVEYRCSACRSWYDTEVEALACSRRAPGKLVASVGDFVTTPKAFGWLDGDEAWVASREKGSSATGFIYQFLYVVTAIDLHEHHWRYYLRTLAMTNPSGYGGGWTRPEGHYALRPFKGTITDAHREQAKALIGWREDHLL